MHREPRQRIRTTCSAVFLGAILLATAARGTSRPIRFEHLTLEDGLSQNTVLDIYQDSLGLLWIGTEDGLNRFDGSEFTVFRKDPSQEGSLSSSYIWSIDEDPAGNLWIATDDGGLARWTRGSGRFHVLRHHANDDSTIASDHLRDLHIAKDGSLWIGTRDAGLDRLDPQTGSITHHRHDPDDPTSLASDEIYVVYTDQAGTLWVGTGAGLDRLDEATGKFIHYRHDPADPRSLGGDNIRSILEDRHGRLWVGTLRSGLSRLGAGKSGFDRFVHDPHDPTSLSHDQVRSIFEDRAGRLWVGTVKGLDLLDAERGEFVRYGHEASLPGSLPDSEVMALFQDAGDVLWIGTRSGGLSKWNPRTWSFGHYGADPDGPNGGLGHPVVTSFSQDDAGRIWVGTLGGGLSVMDRGAGSWTHYRAAATGGLVEDRVTALLHDHQGRLWIGTMGAGLSVYDEETDTFRSFRHEPGNPASLAADSVMTLYEDRDGGVWIGTFGGGISRYDRETGRFRSFSHDPGDPSGLSSNRVTAFVQDLTGALWIGTYLGGLELFDPETETFRHFRHDPDDTTSLGSNTIYSLHIDASGTVWVGTRGGWLDRIDGFARAPDEIVFRNYSAKDGLNNGDIYGIESDSQGNLWLSTNRGLTRFHPEKGVAKNYSQSHGLQANEFNFGAHYRTSSGELFFGGINGFNAFYPSRLEENHHTPPVVLTRVLRNNEPAFDTQTYSMVSHLSMDHKDSVLTFEFSALDFAAPDKNRYAIMLEGFDSDWIEIGTHNHATYTNLDAGRYEFRVKAANDDGYWSETPTRVGLEVFPAPWESWWAYTSYFLVALLFAATIWRSQQKKLAREEAYSHDLEKEVSTRTQELADRNSELQSLNNQLLEASLTDSLTGLRNRRFLFEEVSKDIALVRRRYYDVLHGNVPAEEIFDIVFVMVDLDHFKSINDSLGHTAGDRVLIEVRNLLIRICRSSDILIRWGGDEFLIIGRDTQPQRAEVLAERIRTEIQSHVFTIGGGRVVRTTCSVGFACFPFVHTHPDLLTWEQVLILSDVALYSAKEKRNSWTGYLSTEATATTEDLFRMVREEPEKLETSGALEVRNSGTRTVRGQRVGT